VSINCDEVIVTIIQPMYPFRLVACASKLTELPPEMFTQCHVITDIQVNTFPRHCCYIYAIFTLESNILNLCTVDRSKKSTSFDKNL